MQVEGKLGASLYNADHGDVVEADMKDAGGPANLRNLQAEGKLTTASLYSTIRRKIYMQSEETPASSLYNADHGDGVLEAEMKDAGGNASLPTASAAWRLRFLLARERARSQMCTSL